MAIEHGLELTLTPSHAAMRVVFFLHMACIGLLLFVNMPPWMIIALAIVLGLSWHKIRKHPVFGFGAQALTRVRIDAEGQWKVATGSSALINVTPESSSICAANFVLLRLRTEKNRVLVRFIGEKDSDADSFRRLKMRMNSLKAAD